MEGKTPHQSPSQQAADRRKSRVRVALANLDDSNSSVLRECCKPFGIETTAIAGNHAVRFREEKFEACAVVLNSEANSILDAIRKSPLNRHIVIYGFCQGGQQLRQFSQYGINIILNFPVERANFTRSIRSTYHLLTHEFRRYVRIPMVVEITVQAGGQKLTAITEEISVGGMSIRVAEPVAVSSPTQLEFTLPNLKKISTSAAVCWTNKDERRVGLRFDPADERRLRIREWIEQYLDAV